MIGAGEFFLSERGIFVSGEESGFPASQPEEYTNAAAARINAQKNIHFIVMFSPVNRVEAIETTIRH